MDNQLKGYPLLSLIREQIRPYYLKFLYMPLLAKRPDYFRDCWTYRSSGPDHDLQLLGSALVGKPDVLFLPMTDWHTRIQRTQHLARTFARNGHRCLYLNPHLGRECRYPYLFSERYWVSEIHPGVLELHIHLPREPVYHSRLVINKAAIRKVRAGVSAKAVDSAARNIIERAGYGKNFGHGTGHGIGYYVHVGPRVSAQSEDKLMVNNVITIEPGIYISGWGGARIEDDVVVTRSGARVLNKAPKNLLVL